MPIITFPYAALQAALARGALRAVPDRAAVVASLGDLGCALEGPDAGEELSVEALMNRPDLFSVEGLARALRSYLALAPPPAYAVADGATVVVVDAAVADIRPAIASAVVRGVELTEESLRRLLESQEKLDLTYGRRRNRVSIGLHDLAPLAPPITYTAVAPSSASFTPLFAESLPGGPRALTLQQILELHPKGVEYAAILAGKPRYPLLIDSKGAVLSMPPIINGTLTELKPGRRDIFLDVTGTSREPVEATARLLSMLLAERGGLIESVEVRRPSEAPSREPDLRGQTRRMSLPAARTLLGVPLRSDEVAAALERLGHRTSIAKGGEAVDVLSPPWRFDLLHEADLIEDVAIGLGYRNIAGRLPRASTVGEEEPLASLKRRARTALEGLGFLEVMTLTLSSPDATFAPLLGHRGHAARTSNPITRDHSELRRSLLPGLLAVLRANISRDLPQAIFEVGDAVAGARNTALLAGAYLGADASFTRAKGTAASLLESLGLPFMIEHAHAEPFARGRCGRLMIGGAPAGVFGEAAPDALAAFDLTHPAILWEFELARLRPPPI